MHFKLKPVVNYSGTVVHADFPILDSSSGWGSTEDDKLSQHNLPLVTNKILPPDNETTGNISVEESFTCNLSLSHCTLQLLHIHITIDYVALRTFLKRLCSSNTVTAQHKK